MMEEEEAIRGSSVSVAERGGRMGMASATTTGIGMTIQVRVPDPTGTGTGTIFYLWVTPVPDPNRDGYETGIFFHPRVTRRVPDTLLPLQF
jgi:hypothetical protein